jgi:hypothetical protein
MTSQFQEVIDRIHEFYKYIQKDYRKSEIQKFDHYREDPADAGYAIQFRSGKGVNYIHNCEIDMKGNITVEFRCMLAYGDEHPSTKLDVNILTSDDERIFRSVKKVNDLNIRYASQQRHLQMIENKIKKEYTKRILDDIRRL